MFETGESCTISQKIRKLLALADGNKNEHERDAAMKLALELLSKYNLDLTTVRDLSNGIDVTELKVNLKLDPWIRAVLHAACTLYYTEFIMRPVYRGNYGVRKEWHPTFIGTTENINVTIEVASWLIHSIRLESNSIFSDHYERRSFRLGAAHKLCERASRLIEEEILRSTSSSANSLMVLRNKMQTANRKHLDKKNLGIFQSRGSYLDGDAYGRGEAYGDSVNLGQLQKSTTKAIAMK